MNQWLPLVISALAGLCVILLILWDVSRRIENAGIVDLGWTFGTAAAGFFFAVCSDGWPLRRALAAILMLLWGLRLGGYLARRVIGKPEDRRYQALRERWGEHAGTRFLGVFLFQAVLAVFFALPALIVSRNPYPQLRPLEYAGVALWVLGFWGEARADSELRRFKADPDNRGQVCRSGLWKYSRHPNYFFEWLIWVGWAIFALASPEGWIALACPLAMLFFLYKVTGIPATEAAALRSKPQAYARYQETTSAFVPWFPRRPRISSHE